jgi:hypothetical protein
MLNRYRALGLSMSVILSANASRFSQRPRSALPLNANTGISSGLLMPATRIQPLFLGALKRARRIGARR